MNATESPRRKGRPAGRLTPTQRTVLRVIYDCLVAGEPPGVRDISRLRGVSPKNIQGTISILDGLVRQGYVTISGGARGIRIVGATLTLTIDDTPEGARLRAALTTEDTPCSEPSAS